jgi:hypothetical protein
MSANNKFDPSPLIELLELSISSKSLFKKHFQFKSEDSLQHVFKFTIAPNGFNKCQYKTQIKYNPEFKDYNPDSFFDSSSSSLFRRLQYKYDLEDSTEFFKEEEIIPNLTIDFMDGQPLLSIEYAPTKVAIEDSQTYPFKIYWWNKKQSLGVKKTHTEYTRTYELSHGILKTTLTHEEYQDIFQRFNTNLDNAQGINDMNKLKVRLNDLKGILNK